MSHLLFWPTITYFYPLGNTSAVCLTENLPPEQDADILLLACGDPRHILNTVYMNDTNSSIRPRKLDITCCDVDAAVLARNALLFTLLADEGVEGKLNNLWNIFYHMLIDQTSLSILLAQCRKLVDLAENPDTWRAGPYAHFLSTCDAATLSELRRFWSMYVDTASLSPKEAKRFQQAFRDGMRDTARRTGTANTASRSAGPLGPYVVKSVSGVFIKFWSSGVAEGGSGTPTQPLSVNPTFAFSLHGNQFAVHYGTDPIAGFHLAEPFASGKFNLSGNEISPKELVRAAKEQFSRWCIAVIKLLSLKNDSTSPPPFVIRMFNGDALMFCQAMSYCAVTKSTATPFNIAAWRFFRINLDEHSYGPNAPSPAPTSFNVIDTSNVLDHIGLINLLIATSPLLTSTPFATLYTEALLRKERDPSKDVLGHLCGDLSTMSLLLGIVPSSFVSRFTIRSNIHESLTMSAESRQYFERLAWRAIRQPRARDALPQHLSFSPEDLAAFLFRVYQNMFFHEDIALKFQSLSLSPSEKLRNFQQSGVLHYSRRSFALLVHHARSRVHADWSRVMALLEELILSDTKLLVGRNYYQELSCHLHLLGIYTPEWMSIPRIRELQNEKPAPFRDWTTVPQVVTVVLVVPRDVISRLESDFREVGTPIFQCDISAGPLHNSFAAISASFGRFETMGTGESKIGIVTEDKVRPPWGSKSPLIFVFSVPAYTVMISAMEAGLEAMVRLVLYTVPAVAHKFASKLGLMLTMYKARFGDAEHVQFLAQRPIVKTCAEGATSGTNVVGNALANATMTWRPPRSDSDVGNPRPTYMHVQMDNSSTTIKSLAIRVDVTDPKVGADLANPQTPITISPISMQIGCINIGVNRQTVTFPLPVEFGKAKLRLARRSSYIEVIAPLVPLDVKGERNVTRRFSSFVENGNPVLESIHRVHLGRCPLLKLPQSPASITWFHAHNTLMFSEREKKTAFGEIKDVPDTLVSIKQSLHALMLAAVGGQKGGEPPQTLFAMHDTSRNIDYLYIIVAGVRLDLSSHTVVVDAFVTPSSTAVQKAFFIAAGMARRASGSGLGSVHHILTDADEMAAWRHLFPLLVERCRTWTHKATCMYRLRPVEGPLVPELRATDVWEDHSPLCACGVGVGAEALPAHFRPLAPYVVRAAFSPLFSVPYLEEPFIPVTPGDSQALRSQSEGDTSRCQTCAKKSVEGGLLACSQCKKVKYCSKECQKRDWKVHKKVCSD